MLHLLHMNYSKIVIKFFFLIIILQYSLISYSATKWDKIDHTNDFDGTSYTMIITEYVKPDKELDFPYSKLEAALMRVCGNNERLFIVFNMHPNLTGGEYVEKKYSILNAELVQEHNIRVKINGKSIINGVGEIEAVNGTLFVTDDLDNEYENLMQYIHSGDIDKITFELKAYAGNIYLTYDFKEMKTC